MLRFMVTPRVLRGVGWGRQSGGSGSKRQGVMQTGWLERQLEGRVVGREPSLLLQT